MEIGDFGGMGRIGSNIGGNIADHAHAAPSVSHTPVGIGIGNHW